MISTVRYSISTSSVGDITAHLAQADTVFVPALSSRVDIKAYSEKLFEKAVRFEAWSSRDMVGLVATYCNRLEEGNAFVSSVSVWPEYQGQGIGSGLLRQCIRHAESLGFHQIMLEVDNRSLAAVGIYRLLGFNLLRTSGNILLMGMTLESYSG